MKCILCGEDVEDYNVKDTDKPVVHIRCLMWRNVEIKKSEAENAQDKL